MRLNMASVVLLLAASWQAAPALAKLPGCNGSPDQALDQCQLYGPRPNGVLCPGTATVGQLLRDHKLLPGQSFGEAMRGAHQLNRTTGLGFRVMFRPISEQRLHGALLETNPRARQDVTACQTHEVVLYVGRYPFHHMPDKALTDTTVADAVRALKPELSGIEPVFVTGVEVTDPDPQRLVTAQYPAASAPLGKPLPMLGFDMPAQRPMLLLAPEACTCPPAGECQPPVEVACPSPPPPVDPDADPTDTEAWVAGAGGVVGGLALARVLRSSGGTPVPQPTTPGRSMAPLPPTRVRRDVGPLTEPREVPRDDARA